MDKLELLKSRQLANELESMKEKPKISYFSTLSARKPHSYQQMELEKNNERLNEEKKKELMKEQGCSFSPKIGERSQSLKRRINDLYEWKLGRDEFISAYQFVKDFEERQLCESEKMC